MNAPLLKVSPTFAAPIAATYLPDSGPLNAELRALFLAREAEGERFRKKQKTPTLQVGIFESEFDLFSWPEPCIARLRAFCMEQLTQLIAQLNGYPPETVRALRIHTDCWFHITRHGGYIANHNHPMASWSGVYCVSPGQQPPEWPDSGVLRFLDGRPYANMYVDAGNAGLASPYQPGSLNFKLQPGQLILFPGYLTHEVAPFYGSDERITVAFNTRTFTGANR